MKITFLGGGNMASALIGGLLQQGFAAADIQVLELQAEGRARLQQQFGVRAVAVLDDAALACEMLVLAVKPQQMREALAPLQGRLSEQLVLSIAAGLRVADLSRWLGGHTRVVRAMPNTPALIGLGVTGLYAPACVDAAERGAVDRVLAAVGSSVWVSEEAQLDAVTALSGSGPAYVFHFIEALEAAGMTLGLLPEVARRLAIDTLVGASALAAQSPESPAVLRERVTSKGGTTAAALQVFGEGDMAGLVLRALQAAAARSEALGDELGDKTGKA